MDKKLMTYEDLQLQDPSTVGVEGLEGLNRESGQERLGVAELRDLSKMKGPIYTPGSYTESYYLGAFTPHNDVNMSWQEDEYAQGIKGADINHDPDSLFDAYQYKAETLATADKWFNGIAKGVTTAAITYARGTATMLTGIAEAINHGEFSYVFKNYGDKWLTDLEKTIENDWLPNYYTEEELNRPWYLNLGTANFWADGVIKNTGFTVGAAVLGSHVTALFSWAGPVAPFIGAFYSAFAESKTEAIHTYDEMMEAHAERDELYYRELYDEIIKDDMINNPNNYVGEDAEWDFSGGAQLEVYDPEGNVIYPEGDIVSKNRPSADAINKLNELKKSREEGNKLAEAEASNAGNFTLAVGTTFLVGPKLRVFGRLFKGGYKSTRKIKQHIKWVEEAAKGRPAKEMAREGAKRTGKYVAKNKTLLKEVAKDSAAEGFEEGVQNWIDNTSQNYYGRNIDEFYTAMRDPNAQIETRNVFQSMGDMIVEAGRSGVDTFTDIDTYEEVFMGAITPIFGFPMINTLKGRRALRGGRWLDWYGGVAEHRTLVNDYNANLKKHVDHMNSKVNMFNDFVDGKLSSDEAMDFMINNNLQKRFNYKEDRALEEGDKLEYLNAVHSNLIADIMYFDNAGKLDEYIQMLDDVMVDDPTALKNIVVMSSELIDKGKYVGPFIDANGKPLNLTEEGTEIMKTKIRDQINHIKNNITEYKSIGELIDKATHGTLTLEQLNEMIWLQSTINNWDSRMEEIHGNSQEVFNTAFEYLNNLLEFEGKSSEDMLGMSTSELLKNITNSIVVNKSNIRDILPEVTNFVGLLSKGNVAQLKHVLKNNPKAIDAVVNILESGIIDIDQNKVNELSEEINDFKRMTESQSEFTLRLNSFLNNPNLLAEHQQAIDEFVALKNQENNINLAKRQLKGAKSFKQFSGIASLIDNSKLAIDALASNGNKYAKTFLRTENALLGLGKNIENKTKNQEWSNNLAYKIYQVIDNAALQMEKVSDLISPDSELYSVDNDDLFLGVTETNSLDLRIELLDGIRELLSEFEESEDWKEGYKSRHKEAKEKLKEDKKLAKKKIKEYNKKQLKRDKEERKKGKKRPFLKDKKEDTTKKDTNRKEDNKKQESKVTPDIKRLTPPPIKRKSKMMLSITDNEGNRVPLEGELSDQYLFSFLDFLVGKTLVVDSNNIEEYLGNIGISMDQDVSNLSPQIFDIINKYLNSEMSIYEAIDELNNNIAEYKDNPQNGNTTAELHGVNTAEYLERAPILKEKKHLYDAVPELFRTDDGRLVTFDKAFEGFEGIYKYLRENGKFDYLNKGLLKEGDTVYLKVDKKLNKDLGRDVILFTTLEGLVVGVLQENQKGGSVEGLTELRTQVLEGASKTEGDYIHNVSTKVNKIMDGTYEFVSKEVSLENVEGLDISNTILSIAKDGQIDTNNSKINPGQLANSIGKDGRVYLQVKNPSGRYFPIMLEVRTLNQMGLKSEKFRATETYKLLYDAVSDLANAKNEELVVSAREKLSLILYIDNIKTNLRQGDTGSFLTFAKVIVDENGVPIKTWDAKLGRDVRLEINAKNVNLDQLNEVSITINDDGTMGEETSGADIDKIINQIFDSLLELQPSFHVSRAMINTPGYNQRLINDGLLSTNLESLDHRNTWFIADPIIDGKSTPIKYESEVKNVTNNPIDNSKGNSFRIGNKDFTVENNTIYDDKGNVVENHKDEQLLLDLDWAKRTYNNASNGLDMRNGVVLIPNSDRVLNTKTFKYLNGSAKTKFLASINKLTVKGNTKETKTSKTVTLIIESIEENQSKVDKTSTDSDHYYILEEDGEMHPYERVTLVIGSNFTLKESIQSEIDSVQNKLDSLKTHKDKDTYYRELIDKYGITLPEGIDGNTIAKSNELIFNVVKEAILDEKMPNRKRALDAGTAVDSIIRDFFLGNTEIKKPSNMTQFAFKELKASLEVIKESMERNGQEFLTNNLVLFHKFSDGRRIAGEVDILAINKEKNQIFIYDVKTSKYSFYSSEGNLADTFVRPWKKGQRSSKELYTMQLSGYKNLFENQYGFPISGLAILPFHLHYDNDGNVSNVDKLPGIAIDYDNTVPIRREETVQKQEIKTENTEVEEELKVEEPVSKVVDNTIEKDGPIKVSPKEYTDEYDNPKDNQPKIRLENGQPGFFQDRDGNIYKADLADYDTINGVPVKLARVYVYNNGKAVYKESHLVLPNGISLIRFRDGISSTDEKILSGIKEFMSNEKNQGAIDSNIKQKLSQESPLVRKSINKNTVVKDIKLAESIEKVKEPKGEEGLEVVEIANALENSLKLDSEKSDDEIIAELMSGKRTAGAGNKRRPSSRAEKRREKRKKNSGDSGPRINSLERKVDDTSRKLWSKDKEIAWLEKALPQLSELDRVLIVEGIIEVQNKGVKAWGQFKDNVIILSDMAAEGTLYHEAFHAVFNLILNDSGRDKIMLEMYKGAENKGKSYEQLEEEMAEGFREYSMSRSSITGKIKNFLTETYDKIMSFVGIGREISILDSLYKDIYDGNLAQQELNLIDQMEKTEGEMFHGTASETLEQFDYKFLLSGEGANAYTAGFYFTEGYSEADMYRLRALANSAHNIISYIAHTLNNIPSLLGVSASVLDLQYSKVLFDYMSRVMNIVVNSSEKYNRLTQLTKNEESLNSKIDNLSKVIDASMELDTLKALEPKFKELYEKLNINSEAKILLEQLVNRALGQAESLVAATQLSFVRNTFGDMLQKGELIVRTNGGGVYSIKLNYDNSRIINLDGRQSSEESQRFIDMLSKYASSRVDINFVTSQLLNSSLNGKIDNFKAMKYLMEADKLKNNPDALKQEELLYKIFTELMANPKRKLMNFISQVEVALTGGDQNIRGKVQRELTDFYLSQGFQGASHISGHSGNQHIIMYDTDAIEIGRNIIKEKADNTYSSMQEAISTWNEYGKKLPTVSYEKSGMYVVANNVGSTYADNGITVVDSDRILADLLGVDINSVDKALVELIESNSDGAILIEELFDAKVLAYAKSGMAVLGNKYSFNEATKNVYTSETQRKVPYNEYQKKLVEHGVMVAEDKKFNNSVDVGDGYISDYLYDDNFTKKESRELNDLLNNFLARFGVSIKDAAQMSKDGESFIDLSTKTIFAKTQSDIPALAGNMIAFMMRNDPTVSKLLRDIVKNKLGKNATNEQINSELRDNIQEYTNVLGELITQTIKQLYDKLNSNIPFKGSIKDLISISKKWFNKMAFRNNLYFNLLNKASQISEHILEGDTDIILSKAFENSIKVTEEVFHNTASEAEFSAIRRVTNISRNGKKVFALSGTSALAMLGSIYRPFGDLYQELQLVADPSKTSLEIVSIIQEEFASIPSRYRKGNDTSVIGDRISFDIIVNKNGTNYNDISISESGIISHKFTGESLGLVQYSDQVMESEDSQRIGTIYLTPEARERFTVQSINVVSEPSRANKAVALRYNEDMTIGEITNYRDILESKLNSDKISDAIDYNGFIKHSFELSDLSKIPTLRQLSNNDRVNSLYNLSNSVNSLQNSDVFALLNNESKLELLSEGISPLMYNKMSKKELENIRRCLGI